MNDNDVLQVRNLSKMYKLYDKPIDRLKETFHPFGKKYHDEFYALNDVTFSVKKGEVVGVIGKNGSGKSTLLQVITGVLTPSQGSVDVVGKISALLELGAGFNPELTGIENVYFKSSLLGYSSAETDGKIDDILSFADIGKFINQPVKTYSSGMFVRLAFAVAINVEPDILIIDEALSVGDFRFRQKCMRKFDEFRENNKTIFFVSHDHGSIIRFCTSAIWLVDGKIQEIGDPGDVCKNYISYMSYGTIAGEEVEKVDQDTVLVTEKTTKSSISLAGISWDEVKDCSSFGTGGVEIKRVAFYAKKGEKKIEIFEGGIRVVFCIEVVVKQDIHEPIAGFHLANAKGSHLFGINSAVFDISMGKFKKGETKIISFEFDFPYLKNDLYTLSPAIAEGTQGDHVQHHWVHDALVVRVESLHAAAKLGNHLVIRDNFTIEVNS